MNQIVPYWTWAASLLALAVTYSAALEAGESRAWRMARVSSVSRHQDKR
jgi:hypothetical protein